MTANSIRLFPGPRIVRGYRAAHLKGDLRAGLNVALLAFPQGIAYAAIAGIPIEFGLFGSAVAAVLGPLFGGSRFIVLGPTNATAVMLFSSFLAMGVMVESARALLVPMIVVLAGLFLVAGAFFQVASLIQYVSRTVVTGYITAAAIYIIVNQIRKVLGYTEFTLEPGSTFFDVIWKTFASLPQTHLPTLALSCATAAIYLMLSRLFPRLPNVANTLVIMSLMALGLNHFLAANPGWGSPVQLVSPISARDWAVTFPAMDWGQVTQLAGVALTIAFLSVLEGTSIGKSLAARAGGRIDTNQEMYAMGMANIGSGVLHGMPASGSLTRSQLNWESGAGSRLASIFNGLLCALGAVLLGPFVGYIPTAALGVLVVAIGLSLINRRVIRIVLKATHADAATFFITFLAALLVRLDIAILLGTAASIFFFLRKAAVPELVEYGHDEEGHVAPLAPGSTAASEPSQISIVHVEGDLFFGAADLFRDQMRRVCESERIKIVILKMRNAHHLDATSILALEELVNYMRGTGRALLISEARKDAIRIFKRSGLMETIGRENIFPDNATNPTLSTARALRRAMVVLGGEEAEVSVFVGTQLTHDGGKKQEPDEA